MKIRGKVVLVGAGGHARALLSSLRRLGGVRIAGAVDPSATRAPGPGCPLLGGDSVLPRLRRSGVSSAVIAVGGVGDNSRRRRLFEKAKRLGFSLPAVIDPTAVVVPEARLGAGVQVLAGAIVNAWAVLGDNVIVNCGAIVEHDCVVGDHAHVATGARLASTVRVGKGAHVGAGATVLQETRIGDRAVVGAGAVVLRSVPAGTTVAGVPARPVRRKG